MLSFSIIALCCYNEFFENKSFMVHIPLYLFASLMHDAALVLTIIRLLFLVFQHEEKKVKRFINVIMLLLVLIFVMIYGKNTILAAFNHGSNYVNDEVYFYVWEYIVAIFCMLFMYYSIIAFFKLKKKGLINDIAICKCGSFVRILLVINTIFYFEYSIFHRYRTFIMIMILPIIGYLMEEYRKSKPNVLKGYYKNFQLFFAVTYCITLIRGNMSGLKFFEFK